MIVVDDEKMIRAGIVSIMNRLAPHWQVSECKDAHSAIADIAALQPDLMMIDISMPGMNGLDLAHYLKEEHPDILKIVLTGHDKFSYIQNAMRAEVVDYLLKPIIREEMMEALAKAERLIEERAQARQLAELNKAGKLKQCLLDALYGDPNAQGQLTQLLQETGWRPDVESYSLLLLIQAEGGLALHEDQLASYMGAFLSHFQEIESSFTITPDARHCFILSAGSHLPEEQIRQWWLETWTNDGHDYPLSVGGGDSFTALSHLPEVYGKAMHDIYRSENGWLKQATLNRDKDWQEQRNRIRIALETNDSTSFWHYLEGLLGELKLQSREHHPVTRLRLIHFLLLMLLPMLNQTESKLSIHLRESVAEVLSRLSLPGSTMHLPTLVAELESCIRVQSSQPAHGLEKNKVIDSVKDYIHKNHGDKSLNLTTLSKVVHMNSNYLSDLFKEVTGENYLAYLTSVRMNHAKKLLRETHLKTYEIGDRTGYSSAKYFSKLFRQLFDMTPSEYRNRAEH